MFKVLTSSADSTKSDLPEFPTLEQIHKDLSSARDDDVVFKLKPADFGSGNVRAKHNDGSSTMTLKNPASGDCDIDSTTSGVAIYAKVEKFVDQLERMESSVPKLEKSCERLSTLVSVLRENVDALENETQLGQ